jgi:cation diffusion facilitator CzcD-associated flavoprotein CzcO
VAAKTYLEIHPSARVVILDSNETIGGTWAKERLYPNLKSNNMVGTYEYSDFPMDEETYGVKPGEHIPGPVLHRYLSNYAQHFGFYNKIQFQTTVISAEHQSDGGWLLSCSTKQGESQKLSTLFSAKMIVAAGLTSEPFLPKFPGEENFEARLFHSKDFLQNADTLNTAKNVLVLGATKSAWDVAYAYAVKGIKVNMLIRESGHGPCWMAPAYVTPLKKWLEKLVETRFLTV